MENSERLDPQFNKIDNALGRFLKNRVLETTPSAFEHHLDEDSLAAFVEGNISPREAGPMVRHLVDCSFCRHVTTELIRLDMAFADAPAPSRTVEGAEPASVADVLNGLLSKIFGTRDGAVFAHNEDEEKSEKVNADDSPADKED